MLAQEHSIVQWQKTFMAFVVVFSVILCLGIAGSFGGGTIDELFVKAESIPRAYLGQLGEAPAVVRSRPVHVNFDALGAEAVILNLFDDASFMAVKDRVERRQADRYTWFGRVEGFEGSQVILVVDNGDLAGNITILGEFYQVRPLGNGFHVVREIDQSAFPDEAPPLKGAGGEGPESLAVPPPSGLEDDGSIIDVMVVYTQDAASASANINAEIQLAVDETNQSYINSGISPRIKLVHSAQVTYTETGNIGTDVARLQNPSDGYMDVVHTWRNQYYADMVSLWVENGGAYCGVAYAIMSPVSLSFENKAFCVVARSCATGYYSFGHELGHLQSARHDWYVDSTNNSPFTYNHGYVYTPGRWRTVMAYNNECSASGFNCTRLQYWSNPDVTYGGVPMGVPEGQFHAADNRKTLNNTAWTVANFRVSSAGMPSILWTDLGGGRLIMEVADLGVIFGNEVQLAVYTEWPTPVNIGICWKMYYPGRATFAIPVMGTDVWVVHGKFGVWTGSGSTAYAIRAYDGYTWTEVITTSPPDLPASSAEAPDHR